MLKTEMVELLPLSDRVLTAGIVAQRSTLVETAVLVVEAVLAGTVESLVQGALTAGMAKKVQTELPEEQAKERRQENLGNLMGPFILAAVEAETGVRLLSALEGLVEALLADSDLALEKMLLQTPEAVEAEAENRLQAVLGAPGS